ncbi:hypothetical protein V8G54_027105 [Vigna mungo]|uniref:Uncharacterized protein n=1 Tax=Vigna mungo TaxID=3915 RepID=A0AAQ3RR26_VIGMU
MPCITSANGYYKCIEFLLLFLTFSSNQTIVYLTMFNDSLLTILFCAFIFFSFNLVSSYASQPSYKEHCASTVPDSRLPPNSPTTLSLLLIITTVSTKEVIPSLMLVLLGTVSPFASQKGAHVQLKLQTFSNF